MLVIFKRVGNVLVCSWNCIECILFLQVAKITAVLEQETWVAVDAPDEFQAIVDRFTHFDTSGNGFPTTVADTVVRADSIDQAVSQHPEAVAAEATVPIESISQTDEVVSGAKDKVSAVL